jgi:hypothetical protein
MSNQSISDTELSVAIAAFYRSQEAARIVAIVRHNARVNASEIDFRTGRIDPDIPPGIRVVEMPRASVAMIGDEYPYA